MFNTCNNFTEVIIVNYVLVLLFFEVSKWINNASFINVSNLSCFFIDLAMLFFYEFFYVKYLERMLERIYDLEL